MLRDGWTITRRELGHVRRDPGQLIAAVIFPAVMVLLFGYVFGSAIKAPGGGGYREYLLAATLAAFGLILLLRYAVSWIGVWVGLSVTPQTAGSLVPLVFPVSMISNSFVPTTGMPGWLRLLAEWNPISVLVAACRELFGNPTVLAAHASLPLRHPVATTIGWSLLILLIFVPLSTRRHQAAGR